MTESLQLRVIAAMVVVTTTWFDQPVWAQTDDGTWVAAYAIAGRVLVSTPNGTDRALRLYEAIPLDASLTVPPGASVRLHLGTGLLEVNRSSEISDLVRDRPRAEGSDRVALVELMKRQIVKMKPSEYARSGNIENPDDPWKTVYNLSNDVCVVSTTPTISGGELAAKDDLEIDDLSNGSLIFARQTINRTGWVWPTGSPARNGGTYSLQFPDQTRQWTIHIKPEGIASDIDVLTWLWRQNCSGQASIKMSSVPADDIR
jgi:hypothetical protein